MNGLKYAETTVGGGQWQLRRGELALKIIDHSLYPSVMLTGTYEPANVTDKVKSH